jgi:hypothetical protein
LWIYGQIHHRPGEEPCKREDFHIMVNDSLDQEVSFDVNLVFLGQTGYDPAYHPQSTSSFLWAPVEIPVVWLVRGANTFLLFEDYGYHDSAPLIPEWNFNNLIIGIPEKIDHDTSWWHPNCHRIHGWRMARYLNDEIYYGEDYSNSTHRTAIREMWKKSLKEHAEEFDEARRDATRECHGEAMIFLELVLKDDP